MGNEHKCPPHYWVLDSNNVGVCCYCGAVKDFGKLLRKQKEGSDVAGRLGREVARREVLQTGTSWWKRKGRPRKY